MPDRWGRTTPADVANIANSAIQLGSMARQQRIYDQEMAIKQHELETKQLGAELAKALLENPEALRTGAWKQNPEVVGIANQNPEAFVLGLGQAQKTLNAQLNNQVLDSSIAKAKHETQNLARRAVVGNANVFYEAGDTPTAAQLIATGYNAFWPDGMTAKPVQQGDQWFIEVVAPDGKSQTKMSIDKAMDVAQQLASVDPSKDREVEKARQLAIANANIQNLLKPKPLVDSQTGQMVGYRSMIIDPNLKAPVIVDFAPGADGRSRLLSASTKDGQPVPQDVYNSIQEAVQKGAESAFDIQKKEMKLRKETISVYDNALKVMAAPFMDESSGNLVFFDPEAGLTQGAKNAYDRALDVLAQFQDQQPANIKDRVALQNARQYIGLYHKAQNDIGRIFGGNPATAIQMNDSASQAATSQAAVADQPQRPARASSSRKAKYNTPEEVREAFRAGQLDKDQALKILREQFGMK